MMTLNEMKLAVCEKLPELICKGYSNHTCDVKIFQWYTPNTDYRRQINWPTEGLQVCHEAEMVMDELTQWKYRNKLMNIVYAGIKSPSKSRGSGAVIHATYEQRLEALCRVWFPERFTA